MKYTFPKLPFTYIHTLIYSHTHIQLQFYTYMHAYSCTASQLGAWISFEHTVSLQQGQSIYIYKKKNMQSLIYNIICVLTVLLCIHTNSFFSEKVQEVKFIKGYFVF